jgi:hypothetical protein
MTCAIHGASFQDTTKADEFLLQTDNRNRIPHAALTSPTLKPCVADHSKGQTYGRLYRDC